MKVQFLSWIPLKTKEKKTAEFIPFWADTPGFLVRNKNLTTKTSVLDIWTHLGTTSCLCEMIWGKFEVIWDDLPQIISPVWDSAFSWDKCKSWVEGPLKISFPVGEKSVAL